MNRRLSLASETAQVAQAKQWTNYLDLLNPVGLLQNILGGGKIAEGELAIASLNLRAAELEATRDNEEIRVRQQIQDLLTAHSATTQNLHFSRQRLKNYSTRVGLIEEDYRAGRYSTEALLPLWEERDRLELEVNRQEEALRQIESQLLATVQGIPEVEVEGYITATVETIHDGDTITVRTSDGRLRVRFACVDAPESEQAEGPAATENLKQLLPPTVKLAIKDTDRFGRKVAEVYTESGLVQLEQLRAGKVFLFERYLDRCSDPEALRAAETEAREARRGVWAVPNPVRPWDFRQRRRE